MDFKAGLYDASGNAISGSTDLAIKIKRDADDYFYDFDDSTFKASGWISMILLKKQKLIICYQETLHISRRI